MGKRTYLADIVALALLYRKESTSTAMIKYDKIKEYDQIINTNLELMNSTSGIGIRNSEYEEMIYISLQQMKMEQLMLLLIQKPI